MPERSSYAAGTPSWVDLGSPDVEASKAFYAGLFGWEAQTNPDPAAGGYTLFLLNGRPVAGLGPLFSPGQVPSWATYITVADADATAAAAAEAGAKLLMEPFDVLDAGRMAVMLDGVGAPVSIWQGGTHVGAGLVNEPATLCWNELTTRAVEEAKAFYGAVFGWEATTNPYGTSTYTEFRLDGTTVAGMIEMDEAWPPDVPSHWMVYFAVEDCDAAAARAAELGGSVPVPPTDVPPGRMAVLNDPHGAVFSVIRPAG